MQKAEELHITTLRAVKSLSNPQNAKAGFSSDPAFFYFVSNRHFKSQSAIAMSIGLIS